MDVRRSPVDFVFLGQGQSHPAWLSLLLAIAGDIHPNPGPRNRYNCPVCKKSVNLNSVKCNQCLNWIHLKCSTLASLKQYSSNYNCPICNRSTIQNPIPTGQSTSTFTLPSVNIHILQFNANGISNKLTELSSFLSQHNINIAAIQESKLTPNSKDPQIPGYTTVRQDRNINKGGGLLFFIQHSINFKLAKLQLNDLHVETLGIKIPFNNSELAIVNTYIPPASSCQTGYSPDISTLLNLQETIILGDFNAHHPQWFSDKTDTRGTQLATEINNSDLAILNTDTPTRLPTSGSASSPDVSLSSSSLLTAIDWSTETAMSSDHLPILISVSTSNTYNPATRTTFTNLNKADWDLYKTETESVFQSLNPPSDVLTDEKIFRSVLTKAAAHCIPSGRHTTNLPFMPPEASNLIKQRDALRASNPTSTQITDINNTIFSIIAEYKRSKWHSFLDTFNHKLDPSKLWRTIKSLENKTTPSPNSAITCNGHQLTEPKQLANHFNKQFTSIRPHASDKETRNLTRKTKKLLLADPLQFTPAEVASAIKRANNSKAFGPDNLTIFHLKHLGQAGLNYLTSLFNLSIASCKIPSIWKTSTIIPLPKPGKDLLLSDSYRPISLLCPAIKVLESLLLPHLNQNLPLQEHQHGFRPQHSTVSALLNITDTIANGFNRPKPAHRTIIVALDLSKAFDSISHQKLLNKIVSTNLHPSITRWLSNYLHGRQSKTNFRNKFSTSRHIHTGVPQGSIISPTLFNFYISDLPQPPDSIKLVTYADDITIYTTGNEIVSMENNLNNYLKTLYEHLQLLSLKISPQKSTVMLATPDSHQSKYHPQVAINNILLPLDKTPKILGVTFDTHFTFTPHCQTVIKKASKRITILKALAGTSWGQHKETILATYKTICRPVYNYAAPIWSPYLSNSNFNRLQTLQNSALRIATGCHLMSSISHLHQETNILPVHEHCDLLSAQYLASTSQPSHPCNSLYSNPAIRPRKMKETLHSKYHRIVEMLTHPGLTLKQAYQRIHSYYINLVLEDQDLNPLLNTLPPPINKNECKLTRKARSILAQLRSSYCQLLNSYQHRLNPAIANSCPKCFGQPHDVLHLFDCPNNPTTLTIIDLWNSPLEMTEFLKRWQ